MEIPLLNGTNCFSLPGYVEWDSEEEMPESGSDFEMEDKTTRGKRKSIYAENSDEDESDEAWAPGKALKVGIEMDEGGVWEGDFHFVMLRKLISGWAESS